MDGFIAKYLREHCLISEESSLDLWISSFLTESKEELFFLQSKHSERTICHFLSIVFQDAAPVVAVEGFLFAVDETRTRLFVKHVDTTGFFQPRRLQSSITQALLNAIFALFSPSFIHLTAVAKPSFLFPLSQKNPLKQPLSSSRLASWWRKVLSANFQIVGNCELPSLPLVPLFDEDVKRKHFESVFLGSSHFTKDAFFSTLSIRDEFQNGGAAVFVAFAPNATPATQPSATAVTVSQCLELLNRASFATRESSQAFWASLQRLGCNPAGFVLQVKPMQAPVGILCSPPAANDIQTLIRRKAKQ